MLILSIEHIVSDEKANMELLAQFVFETTSVKL